MQIAESGGGWGGGDGKVIFYNLTEKDRRDAAEQGVATVLAVMLRVLFEANPDREAGLRAFRESISTILAQMTPTDVPKENRNAYRKAAEDRAEAIIKMALSLGPAAPTTNRLQ